MNKCNKIIDFLLIWEFLCKMSYNVLKSVLSYGLITEKLVTFEGYSSN